MKTKTLLCLLFIVSALFCSGQKEWSNWYFSGNNLLTFKNNNAPQMQRDFISPAPDYWWSYRYNSYNGTSYSDPVTGDMRFVLAGRFAYDKNYDLIEKSLGLKVCPGEKYSFHIIPFHDNKDKFYIIQHQSVFADLLAAQTGLQVRCPNAIGLGYSVLDLNLNNGLGDFTSMNNVLLSPTTDGIVLVRHANGKDVWVITRKYGENKFYSYLFSDTGISTPVISNIGPEVWNTSPAISGNVIASHDGKTIAVQSAEHKFLELYDFNNNNGSLLNYKELNIPSPVKRMIFSPDDSKLYFIGGYWTPGIYQFDFNEADVQSSLIKIAEDQYTSYNDMQLGPDGKIYLSGQYFIDWETYTDEYYLSVITCPNLPKYACNFILKGVSTPFSYGQFPSLINDHVKQPKAPRITEFSLGNDTAICFGSFKLSAPEGWQNYRWNTGATTREINTSVPGLYYVLAGDEGFSCPTAFGYINLKNAAKPLDLGKDTIICPNMTYTLTMPAEYNTALWNDGTTTLAKIILNSGTYSVIGKDDNGCTNWDTVYVGINNFPKANFGNDTTLCKDQTLTLKLEPNSMWFPQKPVYLWQNGFQGESLTVSKAGTYWGQVTFQGCTISDTIQVNYIDRENINLGADTTLCFGESLQLGVNLSNASHLWSTGETTSEITVKENGSYWIRVDNGSCTMIDTIQVQFQTKPVVSLGKDTALCENQNLILMADYPGTTNIWQDGSTNKSLVVSKEGLYHVTVNNKGCSTSDTIIVNYKNLPVITLAKDTGMCQGETLVLDAHHESIDKYLWQNGTTLSTFTVNKEGIYPFKVTGKNGCTKESSVFVTTAPLPYFSLPEDTVLCINQKLLININLPGAIYKWNTNHNNGSISITQEGLYWLEVSQNGCSKRDSIIVGFKPLPEIFLGYDTLLCEGDKINLNATTAGASYIWQDNKTVSIYEVNKPGLYYVDVLKNGCSKRDSINISYRYKPRFKLGNDTTLCLGQELLLSPNISNATIIWNTGSTAPSMLVKEPGIYELIATNTCGSTSDQIEISKGSCRLIMPNAFTPNNDGLNDLFRLKDASFIKTFKMVIYNRWGEIICITDNPFTGWDGKYKGQLQPMGNYVWQITLETKDGIKESAKGSVLLLN